MATLLLDYLKQEGCVTAAMVHGPNGDFIVGTKKPVGKKPPVEVKLPCGKKSQGGKLADYSVYITDDGVAIATMNQYEEMEKVTL